MARTKESMENNTFFQLVISQDLKDDFAIAVKIEAKRKQNGLTMTGKINELIADYVKKAL